MDYEKKYKEALERAKEFYILCKKCGAKDTVDFLENTFSELKEGEDEKIRKEIIEYFQQFENEELRGVNISDWIAWLEKQGENNPINYTDEEIVEAVKDTSVLDMIEPKFHRGEWITNEEYVWQIDEVKTENYLLIDSEGTLFAKEIAKIDSGFHLWTIQDAKDGDVLATDNDSICIFDGTVEEGKYPFAYCGLTRVGFESYDKTLPFTHNGVHPATKEQCDILFQKMKEEGYEWDAENKELKIIDWSKHVKCEPIDPSIIEEKSVWTEEDEKMLEDIRFNYESNKSGMTEGLIEQYNKWFEKIKSLKPQPKQEWSEEDERNLKCMMKIIKEKAFADYDVDEDNNMLGIYGILESWLKSLKGRVQPQWKPSSEYIAALEYQVNSTCKGSWQYEASKELLEQLKKL